MHGGKWIGVSPWPCCPACGQYYGERRKRFCRECCPFGAWLWWKLRPVLDWLVVILAWIALMAVVFVAWQ